MNHPKKVLVVMNTMGRAGAEKSMIAMLKAFDYAKVSVCLLSVIDRGEMFSEVPKEVAVLNKKPSAEPVLGINGSLYIAKKTFAQMFRGGYIFKYIPYAVKNIAGQLKSGRFQIDKLFWLLLAETTPAIDEEYDLAIAFLEGAATYYVADKVNAKKKIAFIHVNYEKAGYNRKLDVRYYEKMNYICCVSDSVKNVLDKEVFPTLSGITRMFPNIVDPDEIRAAAKKPGGFSDDFQGVRLVTVARLHPQKGLDVAIAAFAKLVKMGYDHVRWYVLGDGMEKTRLVKLIKKYDLEDKFILLGSQPNPYPYMKQCDIYVQPSRFEGLSLTLQEALILNKACITTDFNGIPDLLHDGVDALVITFSEENILNAIKMLIDDTVLREKISAATGQIKLEFSNKINILYDIMNGIYWEES